MTAKPGPTISILLVSVLLFASCSSSRDAVGPASDTAEAMSPTDALIQRHVEAVGGMENLEALESLRATGQANIMSYDLDYTMRQKRPDKVRVDIAMPSMGVEIVNAYDGETGWSLNTMQGPRPQRLSGAQLRGMEMQADMEGMLVNYRDKGFEVELVGEAEVRGVPTQKLKVTMPDSSEAHVYLDQETALMTKMEIEGVNPQTGAPAMTEVYYSDYREVAGIQMPYHIESVIGGGVMTSEVVFESLEPNVAMDDDIFVIPEG